MENKKATYYIQTFLRSWVLC